SINCDDGFLLPPEAGEIVLRDVEFNLQVFQVSERKYRARRAGKLSGKKLALFDAAIQNGTADGSTNYGRVQLRFRVGGLAFCLHQHALGAGDLLHARADFRQLMALFERVYALLAGLVLRRRIIESLPRKNSLLDQVLRAV